MEKYVPPFDVTEEMLSLVAEINDILGKIKDVGSLKRQPRLRRVSRVLSVHSSLAIENVALSLNQVTDVIDGKRVTGPEDDITAVKNAFAAYDLTPRMDPYSLKDLQTAHGVMMKGLVQDAGSFRTGSVGVIGVQGRVIHIAPPCDMVPGLMEQLFAWLRSSRTDMLIRSCVFHYEVEFIHPFSDGNGRMGRLWQTLLLTGWREVFEWVPVESIIRDSQEDYYRAILLSTSEGKSDRFILYMLDAIRQAVGALERDAHAQAVRPSREVEKLLAVLGTYPMSATELMESLGLKSRANFQRHYLRPALDAGLIAMTEPEKPTSRSQRYYRR